MCFPGVTSDKAKGESLWIPWYFKRLIGVYSQRFAFAQSIGMVGRVSVAGRVGYGNGTVQGVKVGEVRTRTSKLSFDTVREGLGVL